MRTQGVLASDRPGEHACAIYRSDEEHWEITADYLGAGLARGERVVCVDDDGSARAVLRRLAEDGLDTGPHRARGQLLVEPAQLPPRRAGIGADQIAGQIRGQVSDAVAAGFPGLRLAFETSSVLRDTGDVEWLLEIDAACASIWHAGQAAALCQIDGRLTSAAQRSEIRRRHDDEVRAPAHHDDGMLRITEDRCGRRHLAGEVDLGNREALRAELGCALDSGADEIRLVVSSLRFVDAASIAALADLAHGLPPSRRVVLERPTALLRRMLAVCELDGMPALHIEDGRGERAKDPA